MWSLSEATCSWAGTDYTSNDPLETTVTVTFPDSETAMQFYESCEVLILPRVRWLGERVEGALTGTGGADRLAAGNLKHQLLKVLAPVLRQQRQPPDQPDDYKRDYGYLGPSLQQMVSKLRSSPASGAAGGAVAVVTCTPPLLPPAPPPHLPHAALASKNVDSLGARNIMMSVSSAPQSPLPATPPPQKFVIVSQPKPPQSLPPSSAGHPAGHGSQPARAATVQSVVVTSGPASGAPPPQKLVVVGLPGAAPAAPPPAHSPAAPASSGLVSQAPVSVVAKPVFARGGAGAGGAPQPPPELDDLSHLA